MNQSALILALFLFFTKSAFAQKQLVIAQKKNYPIYLYYNTDEDAISGIPAKCNMWGCKIPSLLDTVWVFEGNDGAYFRIQKEGANLTFQFRKEDEAIEGQLYVPKERLKQYDTPADAETFETVILLEEYYLPIRTGKWKYTKAGKTLERIYNFRYDPSPDRYYMYNFKNR